MAEFVVVKENQVALKPRNITFEEAASLPYTAIQVCNAMYQASLNPQSTKNKRYKFKFKKVGSFTYSLVMIVCD